MNTDPTNADADARDAISNLEGLLRTEAMRIENLKNDRDGWKQRLRIEQAKSPAEPILTGIALSEFRQCGIVAGMRSTETVLSAVQRVVSERDYCLANLRELAFGEFGTESPNESPNENKTTTTL